MPWIIVSGGGGGGNVGVESSPVVFTVAPLGIGAMWTSASFETLGFDKIVVTMRADQEGTVIVRQGPDGLVWNAKSEEDFDPVENPTEGFIVDVVAPYAYVTFQNTSGIIMLTTNIEVRRKY